MWETTLQKVRDYPLTVAHMRNILHTKNKYNIK